MSIQINGIDKPKNCFDCPCIDTEFEECAAREHYLLPKDEYGAVLGDVPDWCPITELQTCEDAVSRADVIELVQDSYYNLAESMEDTWAMVADVEALPPVQPLVIHCTDCEDWLERQSILGVTISELPSAQPERLTNDDFETIRIHLNAYKEKLCNQQRWKEANEYQNLIDRFMAFASAQPDPEEWNNHTVACLLAELFGDACACNFNGIDEWLPEKCEVIDACLNPVGVACWEQFLKHRSRKEN